MKKWKIGLLLGLAFVAAVSIPLVLNAKKVFAANEFALFNDTETQLVFQPDNQFAVINTERMELSATPYRDQSGALMFPVENLAKYVTATYSWDQKNAVLEKNGQVLTINTDTAQISYNDRSIVTDCLYQVQDGALFVSVNELAKALEWNYLELPSADGAFAYLSTRGKKPDQAEIKKIGLEQLGYSCAQYLEDAYILRIGSDQIIAHGKEIPFAETGEKGCTPKIYHENVYLPALQTAKLFGITARIDETGTLVLGDTTIPQEMVRVVGDNTYLTLEQFASIEGLRYTQEKTVIILTTLELSDNTVSQKDYLYQKGLALKEAIVDDENKTYIALTFDDGPTGGKDGLTVQLLDGLQERDAHATFFMCGYRIKDFHTHMKRYLSEGHELGNHTMNHKKLSGISTEQIREQVQGNNELIASYTDETPTVMRPTGGFCDDTLIAEIKAEGLPIIMWSVDTLDWKTRDEESTYKAIIEQAKDGDIVLMHDLYPSTVAAVLRAIDTLQEQGVCFVTVSELAEKKGVTLQPGGVYHSFR